LPVSIAKEISDCRLHVFGTNLIERDLKIEVEERISGVSGFHLRAGLIIL
jgi:hypothetical protein